MQKNRINGYFDDSPERAAYEQRGTRRQQTLPVDWDDEGHPVDSTFFILTYVGVWAFTLAAVLGAVTGGIEVYRAVSRWLR